MSAPPSLGALAILAVLALANLVKGWRFVIGNSRAGARHYFDPEKSAYARNLPFAHLPLGVGAASLCLAGLAGYLRNGLTEPMAFLMAAIAGASLYLAARWLASPPAMLKPKWLQSAETGTRAVPRVDGPDRVVLVIMQGLGALVTVLSLGALAVALIRLAY